MGEGFQDKMGHLMKKYRGPASDGLLSLMGWGQSFAVRFGVGLFSSTSRMFREDSTTRLVSGKDPEK